MNTKSIPAILALVAGFVTCLMSFIQQVDIVVFAKRFIIVCVVFFVLGMAVKILLDINFKEETVDVDDQEAENTPEEMESEDGEKSEEENDAPENIQEDGV